MTVKELKKILNEVDEDFQIGLIYLDKEAKHNWPTYENFKINDIADIGYSSKKLLLDIEKI